VYNLILKWKIFLLLLGQLFMNKGDIIYSVDGVKQGGTNRHRFYRRKITSLKKEEEPFNRYTALTRKNKD
jgi:hypothetical protein